MAAHPDLFHNLKNFKSRLKSHLFISSLRSDLKSSMITRIFSRMILDSTLNFFCHFVGRLVSRVGHTLLVLCFLLFDLTAPAKMLWWPRIRPLPIRTQLGSCVSGLVPKKSEILKFHPCHVNSNVRMIALVHLFICLLIRISDVW